MGSNAAGVGESDIVDHIVLKFGLYNSNNPYQVLQWGSKIRDISRKLAADGKVHKYSIYTDGDVVNWYVSKNVPTPAWLDVLEQGIDWTI